MASDKNGSVPAGDRTITIIEDTLRKAGVRFREVPRELYPDDFAEPKKVVFGPKTGECIQCTLCPPVRIEFTFPPQPPQPEIIHLIIPGLAEWIKEVLLPKPVNVEVDEFDLEEEKHQNENVKLELEEKKIEPHKKEYPLALPPKTITPLALPKGTSQSVHQPIALPSEITWHNESMRGLIVEIARAEINEIYNSLPPLAAVVIETTWKEVESTICQRIKTLG